MNFAKIKSLIFAKFPNNFAKFQINFAKFLVRYKISKDRTFLKHVMRGE